MSPAGWLPVHRDQLRAQRSVTSMGKLYLFYIICNLYFTGSQNLFCIVYFNYIFTVICVWHTTWRAKQVFARSFRCVIIRRKETDFHEHELWCIVAVKSHCTSCDRVMRTKLTDILRFSLAVLVCFKFIFLWTSLCFMASHSLTTESLLYFN